MTKQKPTTEMNLLQKINRKKQQKVLWTTAQTMKKAWPAKATLLLITYEFSKLGNTPTEWQQQPHKKQAQTLNNTRKHLKLKPKEYTPQQTKKTIKKLKPLITMFDGTNKTLTTSYTGLPQEGPAQNMIKQLKETIT